MKASPRVEYEQTRRTLESTVRELWYFLRAKSEKIISSLKDAQSREEATQTALAQVKELASHSTGYTQ
jgi:hypothetical protein